MSSYRMKYKIGATQYHIPVVDDMAGFGSGIPLGTILPYSANSQYPPEGFLFCDGSAVSRLMYPDLFSLIGTTFGDGDGSTTFNLPDLTLGEFLEGSSTAGVAKAAGLPSSTMRFVVPRVSGYPTNGSVRSVNSWISSCGGGSIVIDYCEYDPSISNPVYSDNTTTVQPKSVTVRYIIKAFNATTSNSELIDITQYASELNQKADYRSDFTIIYPNNGTAQNPASVTINSRYVETNPFPGYRVKCEAEILYNDEWGDPNFMADSSNKGYGVRATQLNDGNIIVRTGPYLLGLASFSGVPFDYSGNGISASTPCRVKVWKIGRIPQSS